MQIEIEESQEQLLETMNKEVGDNIFIIEDILQDIDIFNKYLYNFYNFMKMGFEVPEVRKYIVKFKFKKDDEVIHELQIRNFITNLIFWKPLIKLECSFAISDRYLVDTTKLSTKLIKAYIDSNIVIPFRKKVENKKMNKIIHDLLFDLSQIPNDFNIILGLSINMESFIKLATNNPRFNEIIRTKIDDNKQPKEIEEEIDSLLKEEVQILKTEDNMLKPILLSGTGVKEKQLAEFSINGGLKPDITGNTIPIPINSNFIVGGLTNITNYYIDSLGGRKSLVMSKTVMGRSGHFARMVMLLSSDIRLSKTEDCNTVHTINYEVKTKKHLNALKGRYYRLEFERKYQVLQGSEEYLIGKKIFVRSPTKCACKDGVCRTCYGDLSYTNQDISIGGYAAALITEPVSQNILSSKHLLTTQSEMLKFNPEFYEYFSINANEVVINNENDIDFNNFSLVFIRKNIVTINKFEENDFNHFVYLFHVKNKKTGEMIPIGEIDKEIKSELYISSELLKLMKKDKSKKEYIEIDFNKIDDDQRLFIVEIENNELTRPLYNIIHLLNRLDHLDVVDLDDMCRTMLDLTIESNIDADAIHNEIIIRPLIRSKTNILQRPDFSKYGEKAQYKLLTVESALEKHPSIAISLSFQALGRQLTNPLTFKKVDTSYIDSFYRERP